MMSIADIGDWQFFKARLNRTRQFRMRLPFHGECEQEFAVFGPHDHSNRRIMVRRRGKKGFARMAFLQFTEMSPDLNTDEALRELVDFHANAPPMDWNSVIRSLMSSDAAEH